MGSDSEPEYSVEDLNDIKVILKCSDYYKILGLSENANKVEIIKKHRKLALRFHSDKCKAPGSEEAMKLINKAKEILTDDQLRFNYNLKRRFEKNPIDLTRLLEQEIRRRQQ